jgi:hypothetical protein
VNFDTDWIGTSDEELPHELRKRFGKFEPCEKCDSSKIAISGEELEAAYVCYECGKQYHMHEIDDAGFLSSLLSPSDTADRDSGRSREQSKKDGTRNAGKSLQIIGLLCCLTIVGAIIGIPLIIVGAKLENNN